MAEISADDIYDHLTGGINGDLLYDEPGVEVRAVLEANYQDGLIHAVVPDAYPRQILGRFRMTVEKLAD